MEGEGSRSIGCKISNMKELEQALSNKKIDAEDMQKRAEKNQKKVVESISELSKKMKIAKTKEAKEEAEFKTEVDAAVRVRMSELEKCERARLSSDMKVRKDCQAAEAAAKIKMS